MEDLPKYAGLLMRGGETSALAVAKYLWSMGNFGEPWTTGVRNACLMLEKLDFSKERQEINLREIFDEVNAYLDEKAKYAPGGFIKLGGFNFRPGNGYWEWDQDGTDNHGKLGLGLPDQTMAEAIWYFYTNARGQ